MADNRTMAELLRAPTEWYAEAIVVPPILAEQFRLKYSLINMMTTNQFFGLEKDNPHDHIRWGSPRWLEKEPPHQDSLNAAAGVNLLERSTQDVLTIIENKCKVRNSRSKLLVSQVKAYDDNSNSEIAKLTYAVNQQMSVVTTAMMAMLKQFQATPSPALVKAVKEIYVTCGGAHPYYQCLAAGGNTFPEFRDNIQGYVSAAAGNPGYRPQGVANQLWPPVANPKGDLKAITTRSGVSYVGPSIPPPVVENEPEATKDTVNPTNNGNTKDVQPQAVKSKPVTSEPANTPFASTLKALIGNKEKLSEMARTPLNEHCSAVLLKKLPEKLGDPGKFLIPCKFLDFDDDPRVPLILRRSFLKIGRALIDVFKGELTFRVIKEAITFNLDQTSRYSANYNDMTAKRIDVIDMACDNKLPVIIAKDLSMEEKTALITVLKSHKRAIAWKLSNIKGINPGFCTHKILLEEDFTPVVQHQRRVNPKIHSVIKEEIQKIKKRPHSPVHMGPSLIATCLLGYAMLQECFRGHKISEKGIEVDKAKSDVISKLPHPTTIKAPDWDMPFELMCDASDFAIRAVLGQHRDKHFRPIHYANKTMTEAESKYTKTEKEMLAVVYAFKKF
uniref:Reverse transcriptase/retrotransposon-derived protein RNase H-like domain-containing protein n=1 Tax=Tanacetum cinerariifolium TaxID=118510 RepID=A0A6L2M441_TANCI|nr:hypothetical protein [Tanacetum cinerariifolium]